MTHTSTPPAPTGTTSKAGAAVAAVAALLFGAAMFATVAVVNVPQEASDRELLDWWSRESNRTAGVISSLFALGAATLLAVIVNHVLQRDESRRSPLWRAFAGSMATAFAGTMLIAASARSAVSHAVDLDNEPLPGVDVLRFATALNYRVFGFAVMGALALVIVALSVLSLRTSALARWAAYLGLVCGVVMLGAVLVGFGAYTVPLAILWSVGVAVAVRPRG